jgi:acetyltransferase-like isoleucine patch superfamily enzyme
MGSCGQHARFDPFGSYWPISKMHLGSNTFLGPGARIAASEGFFLGDGSFAGPQLLVMGGDHNVQVVGSEMHTVTTGGVNLPVVVERDVWIGARVTLLKGVVIGEGSVIGACSVVDKSIPPYTVALGAPCRPVRPRFSSAQLVRHLSAVGSRLDTQAVVTGWRDAGLEVADYAD